MPTLPDQNEPDRILDAEVADSAVAPPIQTDAVGQAEPISAEVVEDRAVDRTSPSGFNPFRWIVSGVEWIFGVASMIVILAVLATIPIVQFLSLGYLLEVCGRVARTGRLRDGFVGIRKAARVGGIVACTWLLLLPVRLLSSMWQDARLIDPDSAATQNTQMGLYFLTTAIVGHILWAWFRGGRLRHFLWPAPIRFIKRAFKGGKYVEARDAVWDFVSSLRLPNYFWLGVRGFAGALVWLVLPISLLAAAMTLPQGANVLVGLVGGLMLATVLLYLPFIQTRFAAENRFGAMLEWREARRLFRRAPIAFWFALLITLAFALPLYLLKIEFIAQEVAWLPALVFVVFIFPSRMLTGWAVGRANKHEEPRHFIFRWLARLAALPVVAIYTLIVFFTQYLLWHGPASMYEQHAFMLPVPFLGG